MKTHIIHNRGFTLIELLVVISIIGMLASVVLASLSSARAKGNLAARLTFDTNLYHAIGDTAIGIWDFNDGTVGSAPLGTTIKDTSGSGYNGTIAGTANAAWVDGVNGKTAISLTGSQYVTITGPLNINIPGNNITVSAWVKSTSYATNMFIISRGAVNSKWNLFFQTSLRWRGNTSGSNPALEIQCDPPSTGEWHNIVATQSGIKATLYIDGKLCVAVPGTTNPNLSAATISNDLGNIYIGNYESGTSFFNGQIDTVRVYTQAITASEVQRLYAEGAKKFGIAIK